MFDAPASPSSLPHAAKIDAASAASAMSAYVHRLT
jgi:hypothetical protein